MKIPSKAKAVPKLSVDLRQFFSRKIESIRVPVSKKTGYMGCRLKHESGDNFGASLFVKGYLLFRCGQWITEVRESSSNYRELNNLVQSVKNTS